MSFVELFCAELFFSAPLNELCICAPHYVKKVLYSHLQGMKKIPRYDEERANDDDDRGEKLIRRFLTFDWFGNTLQHIVRSLFLIKIIIQVDMMLMCQGRDDVYRAREECLENIRALGGW
jgi:hypothetical protein